MTTTQTPQAFLMIGDTLVLTTNYNNGGSPPVPINLTGYTITILIRDGTDTTTLATLTIGAGIVVADQSVAANLGNYVATYASTSTWAGNVLVQIRYVNPFGGVETYDPIVIAMKAAL